MAGSIGFEKATAVINETLAQLKLPPDGVLPAEAAEALLSAMSLREGLVGLAAKVTKQMVRMNIEPHRPAF